MVESEVVKLSENRLDDWYSADWKHRFREDDGVRAEARPFATGKNDRAERLTHFMPAKDW